MSKTSSKRSVKTIVKESEVNNLSKSQTMVNLWLKQTPIKEIHKTLGVRYQFVNNVIHRYCRKNHIPFTTYNDTTESKKSLIIPLYFDEKKSIKEIATILKTNKSYVFQVVDEKRQEG